MKDITRIFIKANNTIEETLATIQRGGVGIALVVDEEKRLIETITDGDIRRAILNKISLDEKITTLFSYRSSDYPEPVVASFDTPHNELVEIMTQKKLRQIPLLDKNGKVVELALLSELVDEEHHPYVVTALVMAGGKGIRLHPLTKDMPKPMLPLENRPLMERTIDQLRKAGITKIDIATHYKSEVIANHFGSGDIFGVKINYINEDEPLGTAGALGLMDASDSTTLVINGDILTQLDFRAMLDFHRWHKAVMTVGVRKCDLKVPYGVIKNRDVTVKNIIEKPVQSFIVNAGIYLLEPITHRYISKKRRFDMTDLVNKLIKAKHKVICFPIQEYWLDIGHVENYQQAREDVKNGKI